MSKKLPIILVVLLGFLAVLLLIPQNVSAKAVECSGTNAEDGCCIPGTGDPDCDPAQVPGGNVKCGKCTGAAPDNFCCQGSNVCGGISGTNCTNVQPWTWCHDPVCTRVGRDFCEAKYGFSTCSAADTCYSGQPYLYPGNCSSAGCTTGSQKYKTCCDGNNLAPTCSGGDHTGTCGSYRSERCGDSGYPPCGAAACGTTGPTPTLPPGITPTPTPKDGGQCPAGYIWNDCSWCLGAPATTCPECCENNPGLRKAEFKEPPACGTLGRCCACKCDPSVRDCGGGQPTPTPSCQKTAPDAPTLSAPIGGATGVQNPVNLDWDLLCNNQSCWGVSCGQGNDEYRMYLSTKENDVENTNNQARFEECDRSRASGLSDCTVSLVAGETYWWRVRAYNGPGSFNDSEMRSFTLAQPGGWWQVIDADIQTNTGISSTIPTAGTLFPKRFRVQLSLSDHGLG